MATLVMAWHALAIGQPFNGIYGGFNLGVIGTDIKHINSITLLVPNTFNIINSDHIHAANTAFNGGLALGYGFGITRSFILGIEGRWNFENITTDFDGLITESNSQLQIVRESSVKLKNDLSILLKSSAVLGPKTLFYGLVGPQCGSFDIAAKGTYIQNLGFPLIANVEGLSNSKYIKALLLGVGMEHLFSDHFSIGIEYTHSFYRKSIAPDEVGVISNVDEAIATLMDEVHPRINVASLKLTYYICPGNGIS